MFFNCVELQQGVQSKVGMVAWVHWRVERRTKRKRKCWTQFMIACSVISFSSSTGWCRTRHRRYLMEAKLQKQNNSSSRKIYHNFTGDFYLSHQKTLLQSRNLLNIAKCDQDAFIWNISIWSWKAKDITLLHTFKIFVGPQRYYKKEEHVGQPPWCLDGAFFVFHHFLKMNRGEEPHKLGAVVFGSIALSFHLFDPSRKM